MGGLLPAETALLTGFYDFCPQPVPRTTDVWKDDNFNEGKMNFLVDFCIFRHISIAWLLKNTFNSAQTPSISGEGTGLGPAAQTSVPTRLQGSKCENQVVI